MKKCHRLFVNPCGKKNKKMREHYTVKQKIGGSAPVSLIDNKNSRKNIFLSIL